MDLDQSCCPCQSPSERLRGRREGRLLRSKPQRLLLVSLRFRSACVGTGGDCFIPLGRPAQRFAGRERVVTCRGLFSAHARLRLPPCRCSLRPATRGRKLPTTRSSRARGPFGTLAISMRPCDAWTICSWRRASVTSTSPPQAFLMPLAWFHRHQGNVHQRGVAYVGQERCVPLRRLRSHAAGRAGPVGTCRLHDDFVAPNYYVRGAITQLDSSVLSSSAAAGLSIPQLDLAISGGQVVSIVSMDLNVGQLTTRQILAGISANNSIAVVQRERAPISAA